MPYTRGPWSSVFNCPFLYSTLGKRLSHNAIPCQFPASLLILPLPIKTLQDPFVRLFSKLDPISPIIVEMEKNSDSPNMSGPLLRSISRSLLQKCPGWPGFRTVFHSTNAQHYSSVGVQYILLPAPSRYAMDRTLTLNVGVPRVDGILCLSSCELLQALEKVFPLRAPNISNLLGIARSFFHHIPLAYVTPLQVFFKPKKQKPRWKPALYLDPSHGLTSLMDF